MTLRTRISKIHRNIPIEVDAEINSPEQIEIVAKIFKKIAEMVDEYHHIKELRFQRKLWKTPYNLVTRPERAMSLVSTFLFEEEVGK